MKVDINCFKKYADYSINTKIVCVADSITMDEISIECLCNKSVHEFSLSDSDSAVVTIFKGDVK